MGAIMDENISVPRPSLYLTIQLTRLIQEFRHRLQERVQVRKTPTENIRAFYSRGLRRRAFSNYERVSRPRRSPISLDKPQPDLQKQALGVQQLLDTLDEHTHHRSAELIKIAADDSLFLSHKSEHLIETLAHTVNLTHAAYLFDLTSLLIERLDTLQDRCGQQTSHSLSDAARKGLQDEKYIANLVHLLRRLQYILFEILVHRSLWQINEIVLYWQEYRRQQNKLDDGWFAEWPNGERPLNTSFPWNIRPSLIVLWGVCWMFYPSQNNYPKISAAGILDSPGFREAWLHNLDTTSPDDLFDINSLVMAQSDDLYGEQADDNTAAGGDSTQEQAPTEGSGPAGLGEQNGRFAAPQATFPGMRGPAQASLSRSPRPASSNFAQGPPLDFYHHYSHPSQADIYTSRPPVPSPNFASVVGTWPEPSGGNFQQTYASLDNPNVLQTAPYTQHSSYLHPRSVAPQLTIQPPDAHHPQTSFESFSPHSRNALQEYHPYHPGLIGGLGMGEGQPQYPPSPAHSDGTGRRHSIAVSSADSLTPTTPTAKMVNDHTSPSSAGSASRREKLSVKRERDPPRNPKNQIFCDHEQCAENPPTFRRPCEWNKHMDKHDRPYKCREPGCDKIQGFTYSGGLLRHQREVHKKNNATNKKPLMCPHTDCNRSSGHGFSRLENLKEHLRRRHTDGPGADQLAEQVKQEADADADAPPRERKRKRVSDRTDTIGYDDSEDSEDLRDQIKRLKKEGEEKDRRLQELEANVQSLLAHRR